MGNNQATQNATEYDGVCWIECQRDFENIPLDTTELIIKGNDFTLSNINIPNTVKKIVFWNMYQNCSLKQSIPKNILPTSLEYLDLGSHFNQKIKKGVLPSSLKTLIFGKVFNKKLKPCVLPSSITELIFNGKYGKLFEVGSIPKGVKRLTIYDDIPFLIEPSVFAPNPVFTNLVIPSSVEYVKINGYEYNKNSEKFENYFTIYD